MLLLGNLHAGLQLTRRDPASSPGTEISGVVCAVEGPYRVYLREVNVDGGTALSRHVLVTLMSEEGENPAQPLIGQRIRGTGRLFAPEEPRNPGGMNRRVQALCSGYELSGYLLPGWTAQGNGRFSLREALRRVRETLLSHLDAVFGEQAGLFQGIMLGDRSAMDAQVVSALRLTGTAHVLTVSGMHLGLLAMAMSALLRRTPMGRRPRFAVMTAFLWLFTGLTGFAAGTVRACLMAMLRELAVLRGRRYEPLTALAAAALCMTVVRPVWALSASFQFSFFVVLGILLLSGEFTAWAEHRRNVPRPLRRMLTAAAVCMCAQLAAMPMQLLVYGYFPLLALPMNMLCGAVMPLLMLGGWLCALVGAACMPVGRILAGVLSVAAAAFEEISIRAAAIEGGLLRLPSPYGVTVFAFAVLMALLSRRIRFGRCRHAAACCVLAATIASYLPRLCPAQRYVQLDVGQGDAALLRSGRHAVLIDVGPQNSYEMLGYLRHEGLMVDAVILSHPDADHAGALEVLLDSEVRIPAVILAEGALDEAASSGVRAAFSALQDGRAAVYEVRRGDRISVCGVQMDVLSPDSDLKGSNERSLLLHLRVADVGFLLTGDLPLGSEPAFVPDVDVLKVAHHGSANATSEAFLAQARPELSLISVGENRYGHPSKRVLLALEAAGSQVLRTDRCGCITLWLGNGDFRVQRFLPP